jgi:superfamily II DNA/RNA helicase
MMDDMRVDLRHARGVVLDECDKMLSLGFKAQLDRLHEVLMRPRSDIRDSAIIVTPDADGKRVKKKAKLGDEALVPAAAPASESWQRPQTILLSATMPESAQEEADRWLSSDAVRLSVEASPLSISNTITQIVQVRAPRDVSFSSMCLALQETPAQTRYRQTALRCVLTSRGCLCLTHCLPDGRAAASRHTRSIASTLASVLGGKVWRIHVCYLFQAAT